MLNKMKSIIVLVLALVMLMAALPVEALAAYTLPYYIEVDVTNQIVTVYNTSDSSIARQMPASTGAIRMGSYKLYGKQNGDERSEWMYLEKYKAWVHYATRIDGPYMFNSFLYEKKDESAIMQDTVDMLGTAGSHDCILLRTEDAKFIAEKCTKGTAVKVFESGSEDKSLLALLMKGSYTAENGLTYAAFQGVSGDELSRGDSGNEVMDLQYRLSDLGYYPGEPDGKYDAKTAAAIAGVQEDLGMEISGACTDELMQKLFSDDAPVSAGFVTVEEGKSGPVVKKMQQALKDICLYDGDLDGIYDIDVVEAMKKFQFACGYTADGVATPEMQQALYYHVDQLNELFGEGNIPQPEVVAEDVNMAKVKADVKIRVREKASTESRELGKLSNGDTVMVLATEDIWAKIYVHNTTGFMHKKYLESYTDTNSILKFSANGSEYTIGHTMEEYAQGAKRFAEEFRAMMEEEHEAAAVEKIALATINTGSEDIMLNLRAEANEASQVMIQIPNGTVLRVLEQGEEWSRVSYQDNIGFLMNMYLEFSEGTEADLVSDEPTATVIPAKVATKSGSNAKVYDSASKDAKVLGSLKNGTELEAIGAEGDWIKIRYEGHEGYMLKKDLQQIG